MKKSLVLLVVVLLLVTAAVWTIYMKSANQNTTAANETQIEDLIKKVGNLIVLPTGENPTVATISDINKLKNQPFFRNAQNGDKILFYTKAREVILYRPSLNKIVQVAPISIGGSPSASGSAAPAP